MSRLEQGLASLAGRAGLSVSRVSSQQNRLPIEATDADREIIALVRPYTMTSAERVWSLLQAVRYVTDESVPGDFVECGVWRGGSVMAMARQLGILGVQDRRVWLYDTFEGMTPPTDKDVEAASGVTASELLAATEVGDGNNVWCVASQDDVEQNLRLTGYPMDRFRFVRGDVAETLKSDVPDQVAILRLDTDWYESTRVGLEVLYPRLVPGGVCIFDDYGHWQGLDERSTSTSRRRGSGRSCTRSTSPVESSSRPGRRVVMADPWLSIITVVKDDPQGFARTIASIDSQALDGVDLVVVDGSTDRAAIPGLLGHDHAAQYSWQQPAGVYPAVNHGLGTASGTYAYFLNAGDVFAGPGVVAAIRTLVDASSPAWLYGRVAFVDEAGDRVLPKAFDYDAEKRSAFSRGHFPAHQGTVATVDALRAVGGFDAGYRIAADYAVFLRLSLLADPAVLDVVIAEFRQGGLSSTAWRESMHEFHRARREILQPHGWSAARETAATYLQIAKVGAYRTLWAPGRPGHAVARRLRRR